MDYVVVSDGTPGLSVEVSKPTVLEIDGDHGILPFKVPFK